ncbi:unnamed protein product [Protopolystoma xenopodis]|uniref:Arrestin C-terminal-like domain-containing protein n=1 Tax=Protopolystoma xenopodis TaxID=117903 RepID=A0A3S5A3Q6_9PLAT|nr:unnamed protein product [Protopolystoma xenopodis]
MAIHPGDARLPRYKEGKVLPVFRKFSPSKSLGLHLTYRDVWNDAFQLYQRRESDCSTAGKNADCTGRREPPWSPGYKPNHHGKLEGVLHINPWLLEHGLYVYVEVEARYIYTKSELDGFDFNINEVLFSERKLLSPPGCMREGIKCLKEAPADIDSYSVETQMLYAKLGGPTAGDYEKEENITPFGVISGSAFNNRSKHTFVPPTDAIKTSGVPGHPYLTYNYPFYFDISSGPDSLYLKMRRPYRPDVPTRQGLYYEAVFGLGNREEDSDPDTPTTSEDEDVLVDPPMRHPGQPIRKVKKGISHEAKVRQRESDLFHADSSPWRPRQKRGPRDGISWLVRAFAIKSCTDTPKACDIVTLHIRKMTYLPYIISLHWHPPPAASTDYCLAIGPQSGRDAGVITVAAQLDRLIYRPGDQVEVSIKLQNHSVRLIEQITVSMHQCIRCRFWRNRIWRSQICQRRLTPDSLKTRLPLMPGSANNRYRITLNPWPTQARLNRLATGHFDGSVRPSGIPGGNEAWAFGVPRLEGKLYALETPIRHQLVPPCYTHRQVVCPSSMQSLIHQLMKPDETGNLSAGKCDNLDLDPISKCRCRRRSRGRSESKQPPLPSYSVQVNDEDRLSDEEMFDEAAAKANQLWPVCRDCSQPTSDRLACLQPVHISYEVMVQVGFLNETTPNALAWDALLLNNTSLGSGMTIDPVGEILGAEGPRVTLPCYLAWTEPQPENPVPVANYNVDQRQHFGSDIKNEHKMWEPSLGKGFYITKTHPVATCKTGM